MVLFIKYFVNYPNWGVSVQFCMLQFLPVFPRFLLVFFHCPGKNTFCHGKTQPWSKVKVTGSKSAKALLLLGYWNSQAVPVWLFLSLPPIVYG